MATDKTRNSKLSVRNGMIVPLFKAKGRPAPYLAADANLLVRILQAMVNIEVVAAPVARPQAFLSDRKLLITIPSTLAAGGGGGVNPRGLYNAANDYEVNDMVYTQYNTDTRFMWICEIANGPDNGGVHSPTWPEPGTVYWRAYTHGPECYYG